jgi:uncharacterized protein YjiS (DUF1127 family)
MSTTTLHPRVTQPARGKAFSGMPGWLVRFASWRRQRATARALMGLSDHTLHDIGISRGEIWSVVSHLSADRQRGARL